MPSYRIKNCDTQEERLINSDENLNVTAVYRFSDSIEDCNEVLGEVDLNESYPLLTYVEVYKSCEQCIDSQVFYYLLEHCITKETFRVSSLIPLNVGGVFSFDQYDGECFSIKEEIAGDSGYTNVTNGVSYKDCNSCTGIDSYYVLKLCSDPDITRKVKSNIALNIGGVYTFEEFKGECLEVINEESGTGFTAGTVSGVHGSCEECSATPIFKFIVEDCENNNIFYVKTNVNLSINSVHKFPSLGVGCYKINSISESSVNHISVTSTNQYNNCEECTDETCIECDSSDRTLAYGLIVNLPKPKVPNRNFDQCCFDNIVLAHETDNDDYYNDFNGFYGKKQTPSDTCEFTLKNLTTGNDYQITDSTYGSYVNFGGHQSQPNLATLIIEWRKVLLEHGEGIYQIDKTEVVAGLSFTQLSNTFNLNHFNTEIADNTVRIDCEMDGNLIHKGIDFKGTGFKTSQRTGGFFGNPKNEYEEDYLVKRNYSVEQLSMSLKSKYEYQTNLIPSCITEDILKFILFGNNIYISDYNKANHSWEYNRKLVKLESANDASYYSHLANRNARLSLTFEDGVKNVRKTNC